MARAAVLGRLSWRVADVVDVVEETSTARSLILDVPDWPGHRPGQHVDLRLTAEDGYSAQRSYSISSAPDGGRVELTVQRVEDGEVSPYLVDVVEPGDRFEVRGPVGGYFVWDPDDPAPVLLVAGGSGVVPLMAMIRTRAARGSPAPFRLIYSSRTPGTAVYRQELRVRAESNPGLEVAFAFTRVPSTATDAGRRRVGTDRLRESGWPPDLGPTCFVCGPTGFVESISRLLVDAGHDPARVLTERFGPTGG